MLRTKKELAVVLLVLIAVGSLLSIAVTRAQTAARKMQSQNNLKSIGLGIHNYESAYKKFPPGCDESANHGWMSLIFPYMESSIWYSTLDRDISWEHPLNRHQFSFLIPGYCNPNHELHFTQEGYAITDYQANPALLYRGSAVTFSDLSAGLSNIWLAGEINGDYTPFGYPFNWRELNQPLNQGPTSFGGWIDGVQFVLADGSTKFLENTIDPSVLNKLAEAHPLPQKVLYQRPNRSFTLAQRREDSTVRFVIPEKYPTKVGPTCTQVRFTSDGEPDFIDCVHGHVQIEHVFNKYPQVKILRVGYPKNAHELESICNLKNLEVLCLMSELEDPRHPKPTVVELSQLVNELKNIPKLNFLKLQIVESDLSIIQDALPNCQIVPSKLAPQSGFW